MKQWMTALIFVLIASAVNAQDGQRKGKIQERAEAQKVAFITQKLNLNSEEAQAFWPLYNAYNDELKALRKANRPDKEVWEMSDEEAAQHLNNVLDAEAQSIRMKKEFYTSLDGVLPVKKQAMLAHAERAFNKEVLKKLAQHRRKRQ